MFNYYVYMFVVVGIWQEIGIVIALTLFYMSRTFSWHYAMLLMRNERMIGARQYLKTSIAAILGLGLAVVMMDNFRVFISSGL